MLNWSCLGVIPAGERVDRRLVGPSQRYMELFLIGPVGSVRVGSCKDPLFSLRNKIKNKVTGPSDENE